jgi:hypothetical protein
LLKLPVLGECDWRFILHEWERWGMHTAFLSQNMKGKCNFEVLDMREKEILK